MANSAFNRALVNDKSPQLGGDLDLNGFNLDFPTTPNIADVIDDDTMAAATATNLATAESIKAYIDNGLAAKQNTITDGDGLAFTGSTLDIDLSATPFLEFSTGQLQAIVLDEDNMVSDSATSLATQQSIKAYADTKIAATEKGAANGVASLDGSGKVPVAQLPNAIMEYQGTWNASTNTPTLADGAGNADEDIGDVYRVTVAGTQNLGSGSQTFAVGDYVILNASKVWEKADTTDAVSSVNGFTGTVVLDADDIDDSATAHKFATQAQLNKVDFISITQAVDLDALEAASHSAVTLNADDPTQQTLNLSGQEIQVNLATTTTDGAMSAEDKTKLDGVEAGATADQTASEIKSLYESNANTNAFTDAEQTKLAGIEAGATADQNAAEVPYSNTSSGLTATDTQAAIDEVEARVDTLEGQNAEASEIAVNQTAHGFAVGDVIRHNGTNYVKAQADSAANAEALGVVNTITDADNFGFIVAGKIDGLSGLTAGTLYYLDPATAGATTATAPTTTGQVDKPMFVAVSATEAILVPYRGIVLD